jgi:hypothetical protein
MDSSSHLGASFFCSRDIDECSNLQLIFPTIAYQLARRHSSFRYELGKVLRDDPDVQQSAVANQLRMLIVQPLLAANANGEFPRYVIIIDALDECKDEAAVSIILRALSHHISGLAPLQFLITSRPVPNIAGGFRTTNLVENTQHIVLNDVPMCIVNDDIARYLRSELKSVADLRGWHDGWPAEEAITGLVVKANQLFIFAATAVKFIQNNCALSPRAQLTALLQSQIPESSESPYRYLDVLYLQVLRTAFPNIDRTVKARLKRVLGPLVLIRDRLSSFALELLLRLEDKTVENTLWHLHSLFVVPEDSQSCIRLIHPSFHDFITDSSRCGDPDLVVNPTIQHTILAEHCLEVMRELRQDMCRITDYSKLNHEVSDLHERISRFIPLHIQYACRHWAYHLQHAEVNQDVLEHLSEFCSTRLLNWIEALSLLGDLGNAAESLASIRSILEVRSGIFF